MTGNHNLTLAFQFAPRSLLPLFLLLSIDWKRSIKVGGTDHAAFPTHVEPKFRDSLLTSDQLTLSFQASFFQVGQLKMVDLEPTTNLL